MSTRNPSVSNWGFSGYITVLPIEPTQDRLNFRANLEQDWMSQQTIMDFSNWLVEQLWIARHWQINADSMYLAFCGGRPTGEVIDWKAWERVANCANHAAAVSKNLQEELAESKYQLGVQKGINEYFRREITALREKP